jgi:hypothetical protein
LASVHDNDAARGMNAEETCASDRVLLHIGYHKTATTWFQSALFSRQELGFEPLSDRRIVHRALCAPSPFADRRDGGIRQLVSEAHRATERGNLFVVSHERLSGYPASGGFDSRMIADRLKGHFPNARVFCLFREQRAMILSAWRQQVVDGGGQTLRHFVDPPEPDIRRMPMFDPAMYRYSQLLGHYLSLFGAGNVLFRPYEMFCAQPEAVLTALAELLENRQLGESAQQLATGMSTPNPSLSMPVLHLQRFLNAHFARTQLSPDCLIDLGARPIRVATRFLDRAVGGLFRPVDHYLRRKALARMAVRFDGYFDEDNARLSQLVDLRLEEYGYGVKDHAA